MVPFVITPRSVYLQAVCQPCVHSEIKPVSAGTNKAEKALAVREEEDEAVRKDQAGARGLLQCALRVLLDAKNIQMERRLQSEHVHIEARC